MCKLLCGVCEIYKPKRDNIYRSAACQVPDTGIDIIILLSKPLRGTIHRITMPSRCGTSGEDKEWACLGLPDAFALEREQGNHTPSPGWSYSFAILLAHATREGRSAREKGSADPVQGCRKHGNVM